MTRNGSSSPKPRPKSDSIWFGFPMTIWPETGIQRVDLLRHLDQRKIGTRPLFAGNITRQRYMNGQHYRVSGELTQNDPKSGSWNAEKPFVLSTVEA